MWPGPTVAYSAGQLEARIQVVTGITRQVDAGLQARAVARSAQIQSVFGHCCINLNEGEVIAANRGADPAVVAVDQWRGSPPHWAILSAFRFDRIGCGGTFVGTNFFAVCLFSQTGGWAAVIPDTSMSP
jgi:hypothetical protein